MSRPSEPSKPGTVELETADLLQLAQRGTIDVARRSEPKLVESPKVVVDLPTPKPRARPRARGNGLVVVVYVLATLALALSIYTRWY